MRSLSEQRRRMNLDVWGEGVYLSLSTIEDLILIKDPETSERMKFWYRIQRNQEIICRRLKCGVSTLLPWVRLLYLLTWVTASSFRFRQWYQWCNTNWLLLMLSILLTLHWMQRYIHQSDFRECGIVSGFDTEGGLFTFWRIHEFSSTKLQTVDSMYNIHCIHW